MKLWIPIIHWLTFVVVRINLILFEHKICNPIWIWSDGNSIGLEGCKFISEMLKSNKRLLELSVSLESFFLFAKFFLKKNIFVRRKWIWFWGCEDIMWRIVKHNNFETIIHWFDIFFLFIALHSIMHICIWQEKMKLEKRAWNTSVKCWELTRLWTHYGWVFFLSIFFFVLFLPKWLFYIIR